MITGMTRATASMLRERLNETVNEFAKEFGLAGRVVGTHRYSLANATFKIELATVDEEGNPKTKEITEWAIFALANSLPEDGVGKTFISGGKQYRITGCVRRRYRYPISVVRLPDGKKYKMPVDTVKRGLET